jgi:hypothetical protein
LNLHLLLPFYTMLVFAVIAAAVVLLYWQQQ